MSFFTTYPYMALNFILMIILSIILYFNKANRKEIILSALFSAPTGFSSMMFDPIYWHPNRLFDFFNIGFEDILFSFCVGGIAFFLGMDFYKQLKTEASISKMAKIMAMLTFPCIVLSLLLWNFLKFRFMDATIVACLILLYFVLADNMHMIKNALKGFFFFGFLYFCIISIVFLIWPGFIDSWNQPHLSGIYIYKVPIEEVIWGCCIGALWPPLMLHVMSARID